MVQSVRVDGYGKKSSPDLGSLWLPVKPCDLFLFPWFLPWCNLIYWDGGEGPQAEAEQMGPYDFELCLLID